MKFLFFNKYLEKTNLNFPDFSLKKKELNGIFVSEIIEITTVNVNFKLSITN